jgi:hypothetical protein
MAQAKRTCVVIAGMHRSGTSALARVLNLLGCGLAKELLGIDPTNETGHWEPLQILKLNDELLESAGSAWDDWTACYPDWFTSPLAEEFKEKAMRIFADEHGTQRLTVMKDPRLARLLPFWLDSLRASGVDPVVMIPIRNPLEVAQSLHVRDGSDPFYNQLLWLRHVLDAEAGSRGVARHFSTYDQLLDSWTSLISSAENKLKFKFPRRSARTSEEVDAYLADHHRHQRLSPKAVLGDAAASDWLKSTYAIMLKWSETGEDSKDYAQLDAMRSELDRSAGTFSRLIYRGKKAVEEGTGLRHVLGERDQQLANVRGDFEHVSNVANQREQEILALQNQVNGEHARSADLNGQLEAARAEIASLSESSAVTEAHLRVELEAAHAHAETERATAQNVLQTTEDRLQQAFVEMNALSERVAATEASYQTKVVDLEVRLHQSQEELGDFEHVSNVANQREQEILALQNQVNGEHARSADLNGQLEAARAEIASLSESSAVTEAHLRVELEAAHAHAETERATAQNVLQTTEDRLQQAFVEMNALSERVAATEASYQTKVVDLEVRLHQSQEELGAAQDQINLVQAARQSEQAEAEANLLAVSQEHEAMRTSLEAALEKEQTMVNGLRKHVVLLQQDIESARQAGEDAIQAKSAELAATQSSLEAAIVELNEALLDRSTKEAEVDQLTSRLAQLESAMRQRGAELEDVNGELKRVLDLLHSERHERTRIDKVVDGLKAHVKLLMEDVDMRGADLASRANEIEALKADRSHFEGQVRELEGRLTVRADGLMQGLINEPHRFFQTKGASLRRKAALLRDAKLLDGEAYLRANPDVARAGIDPEIHYLTAGFVEGRNRN